MDSGKEDRREDRKEEIKTDKASVLASLEFQRNTLQEQFNSRYAMIQISKIKTYYQYQNFQFGQNSCVCTRIT
jgi:hypothetical protein